MNTSSTWRGSPSRSFYYAFRGFRFLLGHRNFAVGAVVMLVGVPVVWVFDRGYLNIFLLFSALVLGLEAVNSALEELIDYIHPQSHPVVGRVKDMLAAATVLAVVSAFLSALAEAWRLMGWLGVAVTVAAALLIYILGEIGGRCFG